ncbi:MAG: transposase [Chloroflexota bacterium]
MIRTHLLPCQLPREQADRLNAESGRIYARVLINHYRVYRRTGHWLSVWDATKLDNLAIRDEPRLLHAHSLDAAQQAFYKACSTARANRGQGARYPARRPKYRTTIWKNTGVRRTPGGLWLSLARGQAPIRVNLPGSFPDGRIVEARLVYDRVGRRYEWHLVVDDEREPPAPSGTNVAALDLGEVHPVAAADGQESVVFSCRELRAVKQWGHKRRAELQRMQSSKTRGSRAWRKLQRRKVRFSAQQERRRRDIEHKVSRAVVNWALERKVGTLAIGDVRDVGSGKRMASKNQQKVSSWAHGNMRRYVGYKAASEGIAVELVEEHYSSQTCPACGPRHKPMGRVFRCSACGFVGHRDGQVGAVNLLSRRVCGDVGKLRPPGTFKYRHPVLRGKRSRPDTGQRDGQCPAVAWEGRHA